MVDRAAEDIAGEIDHPDILWSLGVLAAIIRKTASRDREAHAEMPLTETARCVALLLEQASDGQPILGDERRREATEDSGLQARTPMVATGQQAVAGRRADAGRGVPVGEAEAALGQGIQIRCRDLALRVVRREIPEALIVGQDDDDIRTVGGR